MKMLNIGISMRESNAIGYEEQRDEIARDWYKYMNYIMPKANWMLIPNIERNVISYIENWKLNAFILTGGEDIGISKERDLSEKQIFNYAQKNKFPILGICRGFQAIHTWLGGMVEKKSVEFSNYHTDTHHKIDINGKIRTVNSFHSNALIENSIPEEDIEIIAKCKKDNTIEAYKGDNLLGLMWHPERENEFFEWDAQLIKNLFNYEKV